MKEKTFQEEGMAGEGTEVAVRTCKVYVWKVVWTVEGLQLLTGMERAGLCCLCCWEENRKRRVPFSYSLRLCFLSHLILTKTLLGMNSGIPHLTAKEMKAQRGSHLPKITQVVSNETGLSNSKVRS